MVGVPLRYPGLLASHVWREVSRESESELTTREALKSGTFRRLLLAASLRTFLLGSLVLHQIPHLINIGIEEVTAASILGLMISISVPGRLIFGFLEDYREEEVDRYYYDNTGNRCTGVCLSVYPVSCLCFRYNLWVNL
jgi:hypothetical protein